MIVNLPDPRTMSDAVRRDVMRVITRETEAVREDAIRRILNTPKTGRVYRRGGVTHQASAPGEAPASDTGRLVGSIETEYDEDELTGRVVARVAYGEMLEYGTQTIEPRPFMRPALARYRPRIERGVRAVMIASLRRGADS